MSDSTKNEGEPPAKKPRSNLQTSSENEEEISAKSNAQSCQTIGMFLLFQIFSQLLSFLSL